MQRFALTVALLLSGAPWTSAQITADLAISQGGTEIGTITLELDHGKAPVATANFIGLASGVLPWIDSATGVVRHNTPYYDGIIFHRVIKDFMNQTGSQNGLGTDGPGYAFRDGEETDNGLTHEEAFVISMANSGPNTNGSQIFLTAVPTPWLDGKHIVFGRIAEGASRTLVTTINNVATDAGDRPLSEIRIDSVTVDYHGVDFDPTAQGLPKVSVPALTSPVTPASTALEFTQPPGTIAHVSHSGDLVSWTRLEERILDDKDAPLASFALPAGATGSPSHYHATALVTHQDAFFYKPSIANRTLTALTKIDSTYPFTFIFDSSGVTGTWSYANPNNTLSGSITDSLYTPYGNGSRLVMILSGINYNRWEFRIGFDQETQASFWGHHTGTAVRTSDNASLTVDGTFTLTK